MAIVPRPNCVGGGRWSEPAGPVDAQRSAGVLWKAEVHELAHSSSVVWGDQVFLITAVSAKPDATFKAGLYGEGTASDDLSVHQWNLLCLDRAVLWLPRQARDSPKPTPNVPPAVVDPSICRLLLCLLGARSGSIQTIRMCTPAQTAA